MVLPTSTSTSTSSTSSSCSSFSFTFSDDSGKSSTTSTIKLLYSYGGLILPRFPDGRLRYAGGHTRVLSLARSIPFSDLAAKLGELSGYGDRVSVRCQLPTEDLDALVSVTSDEDLASLVEEYELAASPRKIRVFLFLHPPTRGTPKATSPPPPPCAHKRRCHLHGPLGRVRYGGGCRAHLVHNGSRWQ